MEAGQKFYTAHTLGPDKVYAYTTEYQSTGEVGGLVTFFRYGKPGAIASQDVFPTKEAAVAECISQLRKHREAILKQIDAKIESLEQEAAS